MSSSTLRFLPAASPRSASAWSSAASSAPILTAATAFAWTLSFLAFLACSFLVFFDLDVEGTSSGASASCGRTKRGRGVSRRAKGEEGGARPHHVDRAVGVRALAVVLGHVVHALKVHALGLGATVRVLAAVVGRAAKVGHAKQVALLAAVLVVPRRLLGVLQVAERE